MLELRRERQVLAHLLHVLHLMEGVWTRVLLGLRVGLLCSTVSDGYQLLLAITHIGVLGRLSIQPCIGFGSLTLSVASVSVFSSNRMAIWTTLSRSFTGWGSKRSESMLVSTHVSLRPFIDGPDSPNIHLLDPMYPFLWRNLRPPRHSRWLLLYCLHDETQDLAIVDVGIVLLHIARSTADKSGHILHFWLAYPALGTERLYI